MGGGVSGDVDYPPYMEKMYMQFLYGTQSETPPTYTTPNMATEIANASTYDWDSHAGASPYAHALWRYSGVDTDLAASRQSITDIATAVGLFATPESVFSAAQSAFNAEDEFMDIGMQSVNGNPTMMIPANEVSSAITTAQSYMQSTGMERIVVDPDIDDAVTAFEARTRADFLRQSSRVASGLADIRSVGTSQFGVAIAALESERANQVNDFDKTLRVSAVETQAKLDDARADRQVQITQTVLGSRAEMNRIVLETKRTRAELLMSLSQQLGTFTAQYSDATLRGKQVSAALLNEHINRKITIKQDEEQFDLQCLVNDTLWNLELFKYAHQGLGALSGSAPFNQKTKFDRLLEVAGFSSSLILGLGGLAISALG